MKPHDIETFFATLRAANPQHASELEYSSPFELVAAVLLSAQATDVGVNKATRGLFALAPTPAKMLALGVAGIEERISTVMRQSAQLGNRPPTTQIDRRDN